MISLHQIEPKYHVCSSCSILHGKDFIQNATCVFILAYLSPIVLFLDNSSAGDGTFFVQQYMIPKGLGSFCLFDTRGLSSEPSEDAKMLKRWMTEGVRLGELVLRLDI